MLIANHRAVVVEVITLLGAVFRSEGCHSQHTNSKQNANNDCSNNQEKVLHDDTDVTTESHLSTRLCTGIVTSIIVIGCL